VTEGKPVELDRVLLIAEGSEVTTGNPLVVGAKVLATSQGDGKSKKITVFKYKPKVRTRKMTGHRQFYTRLAIDKIITSSGGDGAAAKPVKRTRRTKKEVTTDGS